jgi:U3 small nucleolar RNA-associated protein 15
MPKPWTWSLNPKYVTHLNHIYIRYTNKPPPKDNNARDQSLTLLTALRHRSALRTALTNRDSITLQPILRWLVKNISDYRVTRLTTDVALVVLDLYADQLGRSEEVDDLILALMQRVKVTVEASQDAWKVRGMLDLLTSSVGEAET